MRILCDHHVATKYVRAFEREDWITVTTVGEVLSKAATDAEIVAYAADEEWVVFTNDDDFYTEEISGGLMVYSQIEDPRPGAVIEAIRAIDESYASDGEIEEVVPGGWID